MPGSVTAFEFDALASADSGVEESSGLRTVPPAVFAWLEGECLRSGEDGQGTWLRLGQRRGRRVVQLGSFVGVMRAPNGCQIEVLPKLGKAIEGGASQARQLLIEMLRCLRGFRHIRTESAKLAAARMPLLEAFISEFLQCVETVVKHGLRGTYADRQENRFALRGKLLIGPNVRHNLCRADRFFVQYDEFTTNRPENRLLHTALDRVLSLSASDSNQRLGRELKFVFADIPTSSDPQLDFRNVSLDRGMRAYDDALAWARLIIDVASPLTGAGGHRAPSLLFPMEAVFEAYVAKHLVQQVRPPLVLRAQASTRHLIRHAGQDWFRLRPDLLVVGVKSERLVLDTKWKLLDSSKANGTDKYGLSQADFYQLQAYGQSYLDGQGDVVLIYPKTGTFNRALPVFKFPKLPGLRLWVLPFCLETQRLLTPDEQELSEPFCLLPG